MGTRRLNWTGGVVMRHSTHLMMVLATGCCVVAALFAQAQKLDFEKDEVGKVPKGFSFALTGQGRPGVWLVKKDDEAHGNVLVQTDADKTDYRFPLAVYDGFSGKDVTLTVSFKPISGRGDQGAVLIWR